MSEEELKAIERLENFINKYEPFVFYSKLKGDTAEVNPHIRDYDAYKTILNLIEKQQKEIENSVSVNKITKKIEEILRINRHKKKKDSEVEYAIDILKELEEE